MPPSTGDAAAPDTDPGPAAAGTSDSDPTPQAQSGQRSARSMVWRLGVPLVCGLAGLLAITSMVNARGTDLRGGRYTDLIGIVGDQRNQAQALQSQSRQLQHQVDALGSAVNGKHMQRLHVRMDRLEGPAGLRALSGPGIVVTLSDAPRNQPGTRNIDPNLLVVHQQDIQAVVNALWAGGAEGVSLQGQRLVSTTGVKCVGNTVVLQGVPYSPPYRIQAVGDIKAMYNALLASPQVQNYRDYVNPPYNLGWQLSSSRRLTVPGYAGPLNLEFARPAAH